MTGRPTGATRFGDYELTRYLTAGGMADLYLARSERFPGEELVVKRIQERYLSHHRVVQMFLDEGRIAKLLDHPNVVRVVDVGTVPAPDGNDARYIAMEYIHGHDLIAIVRRGVESGRFLPRALSVSILAQVAAGLAYAHALVGPGGQPLRIVHCDISPGNVVVSLRGTAKIVDFGIARATIALREEDGVAGKYNYMAPEQIRGEAVDARADLFSLGVILWELTVGRRLFKGRPEQVMVKVCEERIPRPLDVRGDVPPELDAIVARLLERDPAARYGSAAELRAELRGWLAREGGAWGKRELALYMRELFRAPARVGGGDAEGLREVEEEEREIGRAMPSVDDPLEVDPDEDFGGEPSEPSEPYGRPFVGSTLAAQAAAVVSTGAAPSVAAAAPGGAAAWQSAAVAARGGASAGAEEQDGATIDDGDAVDAAWLDAASRDVANGAPDARWRDGAGTAPGALSASLLAALAGAEGASPTADGDPTDRVAAAPVSATTRPFWERAPSRSAAVAPASAPPPSAPAAVEAASGAVSRLASRAGSPVAEVTAVASPDTAPSPVAPQATAASSPVAPQATAAPSPVAPQATAAPSTAAPTPAAGVGPAVISPYDPTPPRGTFTPPSSGAAPPSSATHARARARARSSTPARSELPARAPAPARSSTPARTSAPVPARAAGSPSSAPRGAPAEADLPTAFVALPTPRQEAARRRRRRRVTPAVIVGICMIVAACCLLVAWFIIGD